MTRRGIAEWSPSRAYLSFYKLLGFIFLRSKAPVPDRGDHAELLAFEPQQNSFEAFSLGTIYYLFALIFLWIGLQRWLHLSSLFMVLVTPLLAFVTVFVQEVLMLAVAIPVSRVAAIHNSGRYDTRRVGHWVIVALYTAISCILIRSHDSTAWIGWIWLAGVVLNLLASAFVRIFNESIRAVDLRFRERSVFEK